MLRTKTAFTGSKASCGPCPCLWWHLSPSFPPFLHSVHKPHSLFSLAFVQLLFPHPPCPFISLTPIHLQILNITFSTKSVLPGKCRNLNLPSKLLLQLITGHGLTCLLWTISSVNPGIISCLALTPTYRCMVLNSLK